MTPHSLFFIRVCVVVCARARAYEDFEYLAERLLEFIKARGMTTPHLLEIMEKPETTI